MKRTEGNKLTTTVLIAMFFIGIGILPTKIQAIGQITEPINIENALRGNSYAQEITVINTENIKNTISLIAEGDIADWVKFYNNIQAEDSISEIKMESRERKIFIAKFSIPPSTPNGKYEGFISVKTTPKNNNNDTEQSSSIVSQKIDREVTIKVGGEEIIDFDLSLVPEKYDLSRGEYLKIRPIYNNYGNTDITPQIEVRLKKDGQTAYTAIFPYPENQPPVIPNSIYEIPALEIPTSNLDNGKYTAVFDTYQLSDTENMIEKDFIFSIGMVKSNSSEESGNDSQDTSFWSITRVMMGIVLLSSLIFITNPRKKNNKIKIK
ncbi:MAG: hypothetical protein PHI66_01955 [Candidatus Pacebacteria bacterium]|nr:hypothetical protein [Candidatus Paceibacterota bacterium]